MHGSFPNRSAARRVTINFGFHRRASVLGVRGGGVHNAPETYTAERIAERARVLGHAIAARRDRYPHEAAYSYAPHSGVVFRWDDAARAELVDYNLLDLGI